MVRASGPAAGDLVRQIFREAPLPRIARHADYRDGQAELVDDVLFTFFAAPYSFTGEDSLEISCHGNPFIAQKILCDLFARGCRPAEPGEFSKRAFLHGRMDLSQAEAVMDLIHARSERALAAANQQLRGSLGRRMDELITLLLRNLARIEAYLDFPDEDLPEEDRKLVVRELGELHSATAQLLATNRYGTLLREGIRTVILGEPNVGKSTLLNQLLGRERALVSPDPGTTRDFLEEPMIVGTHWLRLIDTAGLNRSPTALELRGMHKTLEQASTADLFLWVIDSTQPALDPPDGVRAGMTADNTLVVINKVDLAPERRLKILSPFPSVEISALNGAGITVLQENIVEMADRKQVHSGNELIAINARHADSLARALSSLKDAADRISRDEPSELVASDLRQTLESFGQIAGKVDNERMLDQLFASFCIGK